MSGDSGCYPRYAIGLVKSEVTMVIQGNTIASAGKVGVLPTQWVALNNKRYLVACNSPRIRASVRG